MDPESVLEIVERLVSPDDRWLFDALADYVSHVGPIDEKALAVDVGLVRAWLANQSCESAPTFAEALRLTQDANERDTPAVEDSDDAPAVLDLDGGWNSLHSTAKVDFYSPLFKLFGSLSDAWISDGRSFYGSIT